MDKLEMDCSDDPINVIRDLVRSVESEEDVESEFKKSCQESVEVCKDFIKEHGTISQSVKELSDEYNEIKKKNNQKRLELESKIQHMERLELCNTEMNRIIQEKQHDLEMYDKKTNPNPKDVKKINEIRRRLSVLKQITGIKFSVTNAYSIKGYAFNQNQGFLKTFDLDISNDKVTDNLWRLMKKGCS